MAQVDWSAKLGPSHLVSALRRHTATGFAAELAGVPVLLVRIQEGQEDLRAALEAASTTEAPRPVRSVDSLGFHTELADPDKLASAEVHSLAQDSQAVALKVALTAGFHYIVPVGKRRGAESAFLDRVSVGRATNTDIVLRHKTVSKYHGYFSADESGGHYLVDAGSKNGTTLDGKTVEPRVSVALAPGARIIFGSVETIFVDPESLWRATRS